MKLCVPVEGRGRTIEGGDSMPDPKEIKQIIVGSRRRIDELEGYL